MAQHREFAAANDTVLEELKKEFDFFSIRLIIPPALDP